MWTTTARSLPISQVANVSLLDSRTISIQPWEKGMGAKIEKAIRESDLGLNPASMGDLIRVPMPPMTEERRKEMTKLVRRGRKREDRHSQPAPRRQRCREKAGQGQTGFRR
jgi:ribosome recycling factor